MKCAKIRALCMMLVFAAPLFVSACSSSSDGDNPGVPDTTPPTVVAQSPASGAIDVTRSGPFWVAFSEPMDEDMFPDVVSLVAGSVSFDISWNSDTLVITPYSLIEGGASCSITIDGTVQDAHGNALGSDVVIPFTTTNEADLTPPTVASTVPGDGASSILGSQTIEITFSEPMNTGAAQDAIELDPEPDNGWIEWNGLTMEIHHAAFPQDHQIMVTIGTGAMDLSGNHLAAPFTFDFRTRVDNVRPYLANAAPANGATGTSTSLPTITFNFSEPMDFASFDMGVDRVDARINQTVREEPTWNPNGASLTVPVTNGLLPGCTYWVIFGDVTDAAGNPIDPNPTPYQFTTAGAATAYPVGSGYTWHFARPYENDMTRSIADYNQINGTFNEVLRRTEGDIQEIVHLKKTSTMIQHLGRDEYRSGIYNLSMIWDDPLPYIKLPVADFLGQSWTFSTTATINDSMTMSLSGHMEVEASTVDLVSGALHGTFKGCAVHHLYGDYTMYLRGNPVDAGLAHQILWLAPGVGPVQIVSDNGGSYDTLRVFDWSL